MSKTAIIKTGEQFFMRQLSQSQPITLDRVIFANIDGVNGDTDIDFNGLIPSADQVVHTAPVTQTGLLNDRTVVYSVILDTGVGDFLFNYIGLINAETNTLCMVMHTDLTRKIKTAGQRQGNTITESIWLEIDNASESTGITVNAETWQIDYSKRLAGEDERIRLTNYDLYNRLAIHYGFEITKTGDQMAVSSGLAYVAGLRVEHKTETSINIESNQSLYIDAWLAGTATGEWSVNYNLITGTNLRDYEHAGSAHYVERVASVDANGQLIVVKPKSFVTTSDRASTDNWGIVRLSSATNSESELEASTPLAVKITHDLASSANDSASHAHEKLSAIEPVVSQLHDKISINNNKTTIFSPNKQFGYVIDNDGTIGRCDSDNRYSWAFDRSGVLTGGRVPAANVIDLSKHVEQLFSQGWSDRAGFVKLPSGVLIQWGQVDYYESWGANGGTGNFFTSFPNACLSIVCSDRDAGAHSIGAWPISRSQFKFWGRSSESSFKNSAITYLAIGV
ncbi:phage tail-collar fiber domain-containing protein [Gilliamella sp. wkB308]|uniref:phage tail-collar fiber domain-containing protein n=1 Tax=Gilliamella sp. wkB308 TaxID=3120263 RepID=UPI00080E7DFD|nr:phage tail protein [Gilliamella apicola]OCF98831.1 hypothetical protein A9G10_06290 [Gilliamella apicola]